MLNGLTEQKRKTWMVTSKSGFYRPGFMQYPVASSYDPLFLTCFGFFSLLPPKPLTLTHRLMPSSKPGGSTCLQRKTTKSRVCTMSGTYNQHNVRTRSTITRHAKKGENVTHGQEKEAMDRSGSQGDCDVRFRKSNCQDVKFLYYHQSP